MSDADDVSLATAGRVRLPDKSGKNFESVEATQMGQPESGQLMSLKMGLQLPLHGSLSRKLMQASDFAYIS
jgi:hypothetical protein